MSGSTLNQITQPISNGTRPSEGAQTVSIVCNFAVSQTITLSIQNIQSRGYISNIQSIFIDNSLNPAAITVSTGVANQGIVCPPLSQGYFPVLCPLPPYLRFASTGGVSVPIQLLNIDISGSVWPVGYQTVTVGAAAKTTPAAGSSITIAVGGTAQTVFAAGSIVSQGLIVNPKNASESLYVDVVNAAQISQGGGTNGTSVELSAGQSFTCLPSTLAVSVNAVTTGHQFVAVTV